MNKDVTYYENNLNLHTFLEYKTNLVLGKDHSKCCLNIDDSVHKCANVKILLIK